MGMAMREKEILSLRTEYGKVYQTGPQRYRSVTYLDKIHVQDAKTGEYRLIDNRLEQDGENLRNRDNPDFNAVFSPEGISLRNAKGKGMSWRIEGAKPCPPKAEKREDKEELDQLRSTAVYAEILPGADLRCELSGVHFKDELVFRTPESIDKAVFELNVSGLDLKQSENDILLTDQAGEPVFVLPGPVCTDSSKGAEPVRAAYKLEETGQGTWRIACTLPEDWLKSAVYPVALDPAVVSYNARCAVQDAYTCSKESNVTHTGNSSNILRLTKGSSNWGQCSCFFKFTEEVLPALDASDYIVYGEFRVSTAQSGYPTAAFAGTVHEVTSSWTLTTLTHNNMPSWSDSVLDYSAFSASEGEGVIHTFDITNLVRKWYTGTNYGLMLKAENDTYAQLRSSSFGQTDEHRPLVIIDYVSKAGIEDYLAYEDHSAGRAGTGHVSLFNGNLIFEHNDTSTDGNLMPVSVSHVYNSSYNEINPFGAGYGWKLNMQQALRKETIAGILYYVWIDEDGTEVYFAKENGTWKDQLGKELTLKLGSSQATIESKQGLKRVFTLPTAEFNNTWSNAKPMLRMENALGQQITLGGSGFTRTGATDAAGRATTLTWSSGKLTGITAPGMTDGFAFQYSSNNLTKIVHEDQAETTYTYNSKHLLTKVQNHDGLKIQYTYSSTTPYRVTAVKVSNMQGETEQIAFHHTYAYKDVLTIVTDVLSGKKLRYHFNDSGNLVALTDELGYGAFQKYSTTSLNKPEAVSKLQRSVVSLIRDPLFAGTVWEQAAGTGTIAYDTDIKYLGARSLRITRTDDPGTPNVSQAATLAAGTYVLSAWCKTNGSAKAQLSAEMTGSSGTITESGREETSADEWKRISLTFTVPEDAAGDVTVRLNAAGGAGQVWFDGAQLEEGVTAGRLNLLQNSDFRNGLTDWSKVSGVNSGSVVNAPADSSRPATLGTKTFRMTGAGSGNRVELYQTVTVSGNQGDVYVAGGWSKAASVPRKSSKNRYSLKISFYDGSSWKTGTDDYVLWNEEWSGWHMAAIPVAAPCDYTKIKVLLQYTNNYNKAYFNGLFLHKERFGQSFAYDSKGNLLSTTNLASIQDNAVYDAYNNLTKYRQGGRPDDVSTRLNYGSTEEDKKKHLVQSTVAPLGMKTTYTYDEHGNVTQTHAKMGDLQTASSAGYSDDGNYAVSQTDARGYTVTKVIDPNLGTTDSVTDPKGQTVSYTYDVLKRITQTETTANNATYRNQYTYTQDRLAQVKHNTSGDSDEDVTYNFEYDSLGRTTAVKVGTQQLSATEYNTDGTTASVTYGNNGQVRYGYDAFKRLTDVSFDTDTELRYHYTYGNSGEVAQVEDSALGTTIRSEYDLANRPMRKTTWDANGEVYMAEVGYDQYNNLESFRERVAGENAYTTSYEYDKENKPVKVSCGNGTEIQYEYDGLGRIRKRTVTGGGDSRETVYSYEKGVNDSTTPLIRRIKQLGERIFYTYDEVGNILSVEYPDRKPEEDTTVISLHTEDNELLYPSETTRNVTGYSPVYDGSTASASQVKDENGSQVQFGLTMEQDTVGSAPLTGRTDGRQENKISYEYDALGQLVRANDPFDPAACPRGTTWVYTYDLGGNILGKTAYPFTEEETIAEAAVHTDTYTYGEPNWKDQLTAYNGVQIRYDGIGNPEDDGEWIYTWQHGRQLAQMSKAGETVSFVYNEDGLRVQKTATSTGTTKYILHGKNIVHLINGQNELHFFYDAQGKAAAVEYNGTSYRYLHNLQGDVIALIDGNGNRVVEYSYDAWGKPIQKTGTMASTLGTLQPFCYRGYVWDEETKLYYLRSRYYNSGWGRFINSDVLIRGNLYSYCRNNPVIAVDPGGKEEKPWYDRDAAIEYGRKFLEGLISWKGIYYREHEHNCARFVSACLFEALSPNTYSNWWYKKRKNMPDQASSSWRKAGSMHDFIIHSDLFTFEDTIDANTDLKEKAWCYGQQIRADLLFFAWDDPVLGTGIHHVAMVSSVTDTGIYYMQDSDPAFDRSLNSFFNNPEYKDPVVYLVHIAGGG